MKLQREDAVYLGILGLVVLLPVCVLNLGYTGSDFEFHVTSWREYLGVLKSGVLLPAWAPHANFNLGEPRFVFYPPLSFLFGAVLSAVLPFAWVPKAFVGLSLFVAGLSMRKLARMFLGPRDSWVAGILYASSYYVVIDALTRFAAAEVMTAVFVPLVVLFYLRVIDRPRSHDAALLGLCSACVWLTDAPAAVAVFYGLVGCSVIDFAARREWRPLVTVCAAECMGVLLSAWYLLPAWLSQPSVSSQKLLGISWRDNFLFRSRSPGHPLDALHYPLWLWTIACVAVLLFATLKTDRSSSERRTAPWRCLGYLAAITLLVHTPVSAPLWAHLPELRYVQFPFRFDFFLCCLVPVAFLARFKTAPIRGVLYFAWGAALLLPLGTRVYQERSHHETVTTAQALTRAENGYGGIGEYTPAGESPKAALALRPAKVEAMTEGGACFSMVDRWQPQRRSFRSSSAGACVYRIGLLYYPMWHVAVDGAAGSLNRGEQGLAMVSVPAGEHTVEISLERPRAASVGSDVVSFISLLVCMGLVLRGSASRDERDDARGIGVS